MGRQRSTARQPGRHAAAARVREHCRLAVHARHRREVPGVPRARGRPHLYGNLYADIPITENRYIQAIQTRAATPPSRKVVHHALTY
ncbi:MAG: hypothetical protein QM736_14885, partial [Vicinamibacterales bacterium]